MANTSIYAAFERMWQHIVAKLGDKADVDNIPTSTSQLTNDSGFITNFTETDPTVPSWAKQPNKPSYTAEEVGALPEDTVIPSVEGLATESYVDTSIAALVNSAPEALNTLDELAAALGDDENFATTVTNQIASKQDAITGTTGQFVVIGADGKPTTKTIPIAEEATF